MKILRVFVLAAVSIALCSTMAVAGDFDWMKQMNVVAQADPTGFRAQLATRFNIGPAKVSAIVSNFPNPADAYMVMRLGEMSHHPPEYVMERYKD